MEWKWSGRHLRPGERKSADLGQLPRSRLLARQVHDRLPHADWIAEDLMAAAPQMRKLTLKLHAQPGLRLHHNHQQQIPWTNPALPLGKPLPPLNPTSLATKTE